MSADYRMREAASLARSHHERVRDFRSQSIKILKSSELDVP